MFGAAIPKSHAGRGLEIINQQAQEQQRAAQALQEEAARAARQREAEQHQAQLMEFQSQALLQQQAAKKAAQEAQEERERRQRAETDRDDALKNNQILMAKLIRETMDVIHNPTLDEAQKLEELYDVIDQYNDDVQEVIFIIFDQALKAKYDQFARSKKH